MKLQGIIPALTTPLRDGEFSPTDLWGNICRYERLGVSGYLVLGSTGEAILLGDRDRRRVLQVARSVIPTGKPLIAGITAESTALAVEQARVVHGCGADLALVTTPHYYGSQMTDPSLVGHFRAVADEAPLPLLLYNVPKFTHLTMSLAAISDLAGHDNIVGLKESSGDPDFLRLVLSAVGERFRVLCGESALVRDAVSSGASGAILAAATAFPEPFMRIAAEPESCRALQQAASTASKRIAASHGIAGLKAAMDLRGLHGGRPRSPLLPVSRETRDEIGRVLAGLVDDGVLPSLAL